MTYGLDLLGLGSPHWDIKSTLAAWPGPWYVGAFDGVWPNAFGDPSKNIRAIFDAFPNCPGARIHIWWSYSHTAIDMATLTKRLPHWENIAKLYPNQRIYISHSCEYGKSTTQADLTLRVAAIKKLAPSCIPVNTPEGGSVSLPGIITEQHGSSAHTGNNQIASTDGNSITDINQSAWITANKGADICFLWGSLFSMSEANQAANLATRPDLRTASPGINYLKGIEYLVNPIGTPPTPVFKTVPLVKPNLWKPFAEDEVGVNPRDNKPMLWLTGEAGNPIEIVTFDNKPIATLTHFGDVRWYSGDPGGSNTWGWQMQQKALTLSASPYGYAKTSSGKYYALGNLAFRSPFFE